MRLPWLESGDPFPPPAQALDEPNGLLAAGADLSPERLLNAYCQGIFPWYSPGEPILWWSPSPRCVIVPADFHASRSLHKRRRSQHFRTTANQAFPQVMQACATAGTRAEHGTWITDEMFAAYCQMHTLGWAHSVEVWQDDTLVGGIYGLAIGRVFFGESMFSHATDASKIALWALCRALVVLGFQLLDCQVESGHLRSLGATVLPREDFARQLVALTATAQPLCAASLAMAIRETA